jgi:predicted permease
MRACGHPQYRHCPVLLRHVLHILALTAPIYLLIGLGFLIVRRGLFAPADLRLMGRFVVQVALPALLFKALATRPLGEVLNPGYLGAMALGSGVVFLALFALARGLLGKPVAEAAFHGMLIFRQLFDATSSTYTYLLGTRLMPPARPC